METRRIVMASTFYPPFHLGGDGVHVKYLKDELERQGHEVHVVHSVGAYRLKRSEMPEASSESHIHAVEGGQGKLDPLAAYLFGQSSKARRTMERVVAQVRPDCVHLHNISLLGRGVGQVPARLKVYTAHDYWLICPRSDLMYKGKETCTRQRCTTCSLVTSRPPQLWRGGGYKEWIKGIQGFIAPSRFMAGQLRSFLGIEAEVMPNFVPRSGRGGSHSARAYSLFLGVLEPFKGLDVVLQAYSTNHAHGELHIIGKGSLESEVTKASKESDGRIKYLGAKYGEELQSEVRDALFLLSLTKGNENCPLSLLEAMAAGTPAVVNARGGLPELVSDPECGLIIEPSPAGIGEADKLLRQDPERWSRLSKACIERFERAHNPESYIKGYLNYLSRLGA